MWWYRGSAPRHLVDIVMITGYYADDKWQASSPGREWTEKKCGLRSYKKLCKFSGLTVPVPDHCADITLESTSKLYYDLFFPAFYISKKPFYFFTIWINLACPRPGFNNFITGLEILFNDDICREITFDIQMQGYNFSAGRCIIAGDGFAGTSHTVAKKK